MNSGLKQRLVGAVVLICGGLILWPVVFSDGVGPGMDTRTEIPPMPAFEKYQVAEPERPDNVIPVQQPEPEPSPPVDAAPQAAPKSAPADDRKARTAMPTLDETGLPRGWVLQVASFGETKNAEQLQADLQKQGYKAFTRRVETAGGTVVRVYVGPRMAQEAFAGDRARIDKKYGVKSIVVKFEQ